MADCDPHVHARQLGPHLLQHVCLVHVWLSIGACMGPKALFELLSHLRPWSFCPARIGGGLWILLELRHMVSNGTGAFSIIGIQRGPGRCTPIVCASGGGVRRCFWAAA